MAVEVGAAFGVETQRKRGQRVKATRGVESGFDLALPAGDDLVGSIAPNEGCLDRLPARSHWESWTGREHARWRVDGLVDRLGGQLKLCLAGVLDAQRIGVPFRAPPLVERFISGAFNPVPTLTIQLRSLKAAG